MDIPRFYKASALPPSPTAADDGVYFVRPNSSVGYICYIITNGVAVQQDAVTTAALTVLLSSYYTKTESDANFHKLAKNATEATAAGYYVDLSNTADANNVLGNVSTYLGLVNGSTRSRTHVISFGRDANYGFQFLKFAAGNAPLSIRWRDNGSWSPEENFAYQSYVVALLASYALLSQVYTQAQALALFVGLNGVQTINDTKTFNSSPIVPNGTLASHTVNLGQVNNLLLGFLPTAGNGNNLNTAGVGDKDNVVTAVRYTIGSDAHPAPTGSTGVLWSAGITSYRAQIHMSFNGGLSIRSMNAGVFGAWREVVTDANLDAKSNALGFIKSSVLVGYVLQTSLNTQLANYVTVNSSQNITATKTFTVSPIVPNGTLAGHTVNLGQLNTILSSYALASAIPTNNNQLANGANYITATALSGYVLQSSLNTQLTAYATIAGTQTFSGQITFGVAPLVPTGTLSGHTVNLGQMQNYVTTQVATQVTNQITNLGFAPKAHDYREITTNNTTVNVKQFRRVVVVLTDPSVVTVELSKDAFPGTVVTIQTTSVVVNVKMDHIKAGAADSNYTLDANRSLQVSFSEALDAWIVEQDNSLS